MKSFIKTDSGVLYPKGQGKLADCHSLRVDSPLAEGSQVMHDFEISKHILHKLGSSKSVKDKAKMRSVTTKSSNTDNDFPELPEDVNSDSVHSTSKKGYQLESFPNVIDVEEELCYLREEVISEIDLKARETRLTAYEDAIDSVIRKVKTVQKENVCQFEFHEDEKVDISDNMLCLPLDVKRVEREARIADTIDAVIAQAKSLSPKSMPDESKRDDKEKEENFVEVCSENTVVSESSASHRLSLPTHLVASPDIERTLTNKYAVKSNEPVGIVANETGVLKKTKVRKDKSKKYLQLIAVEDNKSESGIPYESGVQLYDHSSSIQQVKMFKGEKTKDIAKCKNQGSTKDVIDVLQPEQSAKIETWTDDEAAKSLMELAGVPPRKRLRISFGSGKERTVENPVISECKEYVDKTLGIGSNLQPNINIDKSNVTLLENSHQVNSICQERDGTENSKYCGIVNEDKQKTYRKMKSKNFKKLKKSKEKQKKAEIKEKMHAIPKMTIKFGGGTSGGTPNSLSVGTTDFIRSGSESSAQAPLKLVIRPFMTDSPSTSTKLSPHHVVKVPKRNSTLQSDYQSDKLHQSLSLPKNNLCENKTCLSPAQFTSSSSSSSGSPYRELSTDLPRSPVPLALSSPAPFISCASPNSESGSPLPSTSSRSQSPLPPTLYRPQEVEKRSLPSLSVASQMSKILPNSNVSQSSVVHSALSVLPTKPVFPNVRTVPAIPPPSSKTGPSHKSVKAKHLVITETVSKIVDETGEITWICPACKMPDDGSPMIGCDICDDWYHWPCVGIVQEPPDEEQWFCKRCADSNALSQISKKGKAAKKKNSTVAGEKIRPKKSSKKNNR